MVSTKQTPGAQGSTGGPAPRQKRGGPIPQPGAIGMADPSAPRMPFNFILPARPSTVAETGLELVLLEELTLRHIVASGTINGADLAKRLHLSLAGLVEEAVN